MIALVFVAMYSKDDRHKLARIADADWRLLCLAACGKRLNELGFSVVQIAQASYLLQLLLLLVGFWLAFLAAGAVVLASGGRSGVAAVD